MSVQGPVLDLETLTKLRANLRSKNAQRVTATVVPAREPITVTATVVTPKTAVVKTTKNVGRPLPTTPVKQPVAAPVVPVAVPVVAVDTSVAPVAPTVPKAPPAPPAPPKAPAAPKAQAAAPAGVRPALLFSGADLATGATRLKKAETRVAPVVAKGGVVDAPKANIENGPANATEAPAAVATPAKPKGMGMMGGMDELQAKIAASAARRSIKI
ncbi:MAG: hypothetical protein AB7I18_04160 [Candidatus Berkiella sp.]